MEEFTVGYTLTPALAVRMHLAVHPVYEALGWLIFTPVLLLEVAYSLWIFAALMIALCVLRYLMLYWTWRPLLRDGGRWQVTFTDQEFRSRSREVSGSRLWSGYTRCYQRWGIWLLRYSPTTAAAFPVSALTDEQAATLNRFLTEHGLS